MERAEGEDKRGGWEELEGVWTEGQVWKVVNRERKRRRVNEKMKMAEWDDYFRDCWEEWREIKGEGRREGDRKG